MILEEKILGGKKVLKREIKTPLDEIDIIAEGLSREALYSFQKFTSFTLKELADMLNIDKKTIERNGVLSSTITDQLLQIVKVYVKAYEVFDHEAQDVQRWMNAPNIALGSRTPKSLLSTSVGRQLVYDILVRIEYGVHS